MDGIYHTINNRVKTTATCAQTQAKGIKGPPMPFFLENEKNVSIFLDKIGCVRHKARLKIYNPYYGKDVIKMVCQTVKDGHECFFMGKSGCGFNGGTCHIIVEECEGCQKILDLSSGKYCQVFPDPASKWRVGTCNMATHLKAAGKKENGKINPLKASKRRGH